MQLMDLSHDRCNMAKNREILQVCCVYIMHCNVTNRLTCLNILCLHEYMDIVLFLAYYLYIVLSLHRLE